MKQIFKYLAEHKGAVVMIILLLAVQAYCDLSLPSYTSDILRYCVNFFSLISSSLSPAIEI